MEILANCSEVQAAKRVRTVTKGALTKVVNVLKGDLILESGVKYDFTKLDKYAIAADAEKLEKNLKALGESNDRYAELSKDFLIKNKVSEAELNDFEESVDKYLL